MRHVFILAFLVGILAAQTGQPESNGVIQGITKDSLGIPIAGVDIMAFTSLGSRTLQAAGSTIHLGSGKPSFHSVTDSAGKFAMAGLPPETYTVRTERDPESAAIREVKVDAGAVVTLEIVVPANPVISGRVLNPDGEPRAKASVFLVKSEYLSGMLTHSLVGPKVTKEDGAYSFDTGLEPNRRYYLLLYGDPAPDRPTDRPIEVRTYYPSAANFDLAKPLVLQPGEIRPKLDITVAMAPVFCVSGRILGPSPVLRIQEAPLAGTRLVSRQGRADADGRYHVCGLPPGAYIATAGPASVEFTVNRSDVEHVDLSAIPAQLRIQIDWAESASPSRQLDAATQATLRKVAKLAGMDAGLSDGELKRFAQRLTRPAAGDTTVTDALKRMQQEDKDEWASLLIQLGQNNFELNIDLNGVGHRSVASSQSIPSENLVLLSPGDYTVDLTVLGDLTSYAKEMTYDGVPITEGILRVESGSSGMLHLSMATDVSTIRVNVADALDKPVPGATVVLIPERMTTAAAVSHLAVRGLSDQDGNYISPALMPGKYRVLATMAPIRWNVPEDLERVLAVMFQSSSVEVAPSGSAKITVQPVAIY